MIETQPRLHSRGAVDPASVDIDYPKNALIIRIRQKLNLQTNLSKTNKRNAASDRAEV